jgi:hypothetical protein
MEVVYRTIKDEIDDAITKAGTDCQNIQVINLELDEWRELIKIGMVPKARMGELQDYSITYRDVSLHCPRGAFIQNRWFGAFSK